MLTNVFCMGKSMLRKTYHWLGALLTILMLSGCGEEITAAQDSKATQQTSIDKNRLKVSSKGVGPIVPNTPFKQCLLTSTQGILPITANRVLRKCRAKCFACRLPAATCCTYLLESGMAQTTNCLQAPFYMNGRWKQLFGNRNSLLSCPLLRSSAT